MTQVALRKRLRPGPADRSRGPEVRRRKPLILASLLLAAFAINVDTTIVNVALPTLVRELHASTTQLEWIVDAYNLVFAAFVLASATSVTGWGVRAFCWRAW